MKQKIQILLVWQTFDRFKAWFSGINSINRPKKNVELNVFMIFVHSIGGTRTRRR